MKKTKPKSAAKTPKPTKQKKGPRAGRRLVTGTGSRTRARPNLPARVSAPAPPLTTNKPVPETFRRSARNLLEELGGGDPRLGESILLETLDASDDRHAPRLADLLRSEDADVVARPIERKILDSGLTPRGLAEILYDRQKTRAFLQTAMDLPEIVAGIIRRAKDRFDRCDSCLGHGRELTKDQRKLRQPPDDDAPGCLACDGVGWQLVSGDQEAVELFLELARLRKAQVVNDFSRRTTNQNLMNNPNFYIGAGGGEPAGGGPPSIDAIIRRADQPAVGLPALVSGSNPAVPATSTQADSAKPEEAVLVEDD